ncbi:MAG: hypothetical protein ACTSRE_11080 [Promethearchaeota archaeon]
MAKTGIGALIFATIFGVIFAFSAFLFISVVTDLDIADLGLLAGVAAALGGLMLIFSGGVGLVSGFITIALLLSGISNLKTYIRQKKLQNQ